MESLRKVLIVDNSSDRKTRIAAIKARGFAVFPALRLEEARSRCRPGAYDLVVVHGSQDPDASVAFCEQLRERKPAQSVLLSMPADAPVPARDYVASDSANQLADRVEAVLGKASRESGGPGEHHGDMPDRASA
jgi:hypothetical protein